MDGVKLDGEDLFLNTNKVIIDTGTSFTLVPKRDFRYIMRYFQNRGH